MDFIHGRTVIKKGISILKPGGGNLSRSLDARDGLQHYVRVSFVKDHPMMFVAMNEQRISNPVVLEIDLRLYGGRTVYTATRMLHAMMQAMAVVWSILSRFTLILY